MKRSKLILSITTLILTIACLTFGVYSAVRTSFTVSGTVTFNSYGLDVLVKGEITNAVGGSGSFNSTYYGASKNNHGQTDYTVGTDGNLPEWSIGSMGFNELDTTEDDEVARNTITITLTITNYSGYDIMATPVLKYNSSEETFVSNFTSSIANVGSRISNEGTQTLIVAITPKDLTTPIQSGNFGFEVEIQPYESKLLLTKRLVEGTAGDSSAKYEYYYRVEFGHVLTKTNTDTSTSGFVVFDIVTIADVGKTDKFKVAPTLSQVGTQQRLKTGITAPLYWRYLGNDEVSRYTTETEKTAKTLSIQNGYYILDTFVENFVCFDNQTKEHNYTTSGLRKYLEGNAGGCKGKQWGAVDGKETGINEFFSDYGLSEYFNLNTTTGGITSAKDTNDIAKLIKKSSIDSVHSTYNESNSTYEIDTTTIEAYFYPLSRSEYNKYLVLSDKGSYTNEYDIADWVEGYGYDVFRLRSPQVYNMITLADYINPNGKIDNTDVDRAVGVRPAFQIG